MRRSLHLNEQFHLRFLGKPKHVSVSATLIEKVESSWTIMNHEHSFMQCADVFQFERTTIALVRESMMSHQSNGCEQRVVECVRWPLGSTTGLDGCFLMSLLTAYCWVLTTAAAGLTLSEPTDLLSSLYSTPIYNLVIPEKSLSRPTSTSLGREIWYQIFISSCFVTR